PFTGERLPAADGEVYENRLDLERHANAIAGLGSDQRRAATEERFIHRLARTRIVQHRSPHTFDRLLRRVLGLSILTGTRYAPKRCLLSVARPIAVLPDCVPTWLMLPVVVSLAHDEPF